MFRTFLLPVFALLSALTAAAEEPKPPIPSAATGTGHPFICTDTTLGKVIRVSVEGKIEWEFLAPVCQDAWLLANGNYLFTNIRGAKEVTPDKKVVWEYNSPDKTEVHSCQPLSDGSVLVAECGTKRLVEVDREGKIKKEIKLDTKMQNTHMQVRVARKLSNGNYLVAQTGDRLAREYDGEGKTVRTIPTPGDVYCAVRLPNGNTLIGCGDGHKVIEVDATDKVVWSIDENELPGIPLRFVAGLQRLPNGNTLVCNWGGHGHVGKQPLMFEVTPEKKVVWLLEDHKQFRTISNGYLLDAKGDPAKGELLR